MLKSKLLNDATFLGLGWSQIKKQSTKPKIPYFCALCVQQTQKSWSYNQDLPDLSPDLS